MDSGVGRIKAEKKDFFVYALLRVVMPLICDCRFVSWCGHSGLALAGSLAAVELGLHSTFADATGGAAVAGVLIEVFFGLVAFGLRYWPASALEGLSARAAGVCADFLRRPLSGTGRHALPAAAGRRGYAGNSLTLPPVTATSPLQALYARCLP